MFSDIFILYLRNSLEIPNYLQYQLLNFDLKKKREGRGKRKKERDRKREKEKEERKEMRNNRIVAHPPQGASKLY